MDSLFPGCHQYSISRQSKRVWSMPCRGSRCGELLCTLCSVWRRTFGFLFQNQMQDAMTIWDSICHSQWFKQTSIVRQVVLVILNAFHACYRIRFSSLTRMTSSKRRSLTLTSKTSFRWVFFLRLAHRTQSTSGLRGWSRGRKSWTRLFPATFHATRSQSWTFQRTRNLHSVRIFSYSLKSQP